MISVENYKMASILTHTDIKDCLLYTSMIARLEREKALQDDNLRALEDNVSSNVDILKRLSLLEKAVFQNK